MSRLQIGARFLAESEQWIAQQELAAAPVPPVEHDAAIHVTAPLAEYAVVHMDQHAVTEFVRWRAGLPKELIL